MSWTLHQNAILTGSVDSFCLICETTLRTEDEASCHIGRAQHQKKLCALQYVERVKEDGIRKVKTGYYCEFCNILMPTMAKVEVHISCEKHVNIKGNLLLKRVGNSVVAFRNVILKEAAWNGIIDNVCTLCTTEFENEKNHKTSPTHLINLVRTNIEFTQENYIFRKIDEISFQCLTCNKELANSSKKTHFEDQTHRNLYQRCCVANTTLPTLASQNNNISAQSYPKNVSIPIKPKKGKFVAKKCKQTTSNETENQNSFEGEDPLKEDKIIRKVLKAPNYIVSIDEERSVCILCDLAFDAKWQLPAHITGKHHLTILKLHEKSLSKGKLRSEAEKIALSEKLKIFDCTAAEKKDYIDINSEPRIDSSENCENHIKHHDQLPKIDEDSFNVKIDEASTSSQMGVEKNTTLFSKPVHIRKDLRKFPKKLDDANTTSQANNSKIDKKFPEQADKAKNTVIQSISSEIVENSPKKVVSAKSTVSQDISSTIDKQSPTIVDDAESTESQESHEMVDKSVKIVNHAMSTESQPENTESHPENTEIFEQSSKKVDAETNESKAKSLEIVDQSQKKIMNADSTKLQADNTDIVENFKKKTDDTESQAIACEIVEDSPSAPQAGTSQTSSPSSPSTARAYRPSTIEEEMVALGKKNEMSYHPAERRMFCHICDVKVPATMGNMKQHIEGANHGFALHTQRKKEQKPKPKPAPNLHKVPSSDFVSSVSTVHNLHTKYVIINERFCISANSFVLMTQNENSSRCLVCYCNIPVDVMDAHCKSPAHIAAMTEASVIITLHDEFVREINPDEYHCGFCNISQLGYPNLEKHLKTVAHRETRNAAVMRLEKYEESEQTDEREMELMMLFGLIHNF